MRHEAGAHRDASADRPQPHRGMARAADASALQGAPWPDRIHSERAHAYHLAVRLNPNAPSIGGVFAARGARKRLEAWRLAAALRWRRRLWRGVPLPSSRVQHPFLRCDLGAISARSLAHPSAISRAHHTGTKDWLVSPPRYAGLSGMATTEWARTTARSDFPRGMPIRCTQASEITAEMQPRSTPE